MPMPIDPGAGLLELVRNAVTNAPLALLTAGLLIGPTALWVFYRLLVVRTKKAPVSSGRMLWGCPECRSVNESVQTRCYNCQFEPLAVHEVFIIDPRTGETIRPDTGAATPERIRRVVDPSLPGVAVGPGRRPATMLGDRPPVGVMAPEPGVSTRPTAGQSAGRRS